MNPNNKGGRKPLSTKNDDVSPYSQFFSRSLTDIDAALKAEIEAKDLEYRFISSLEFSTSGNFHRNYWVPYRRTSTTSDAVQKEGDTIDLTFGSSADGYVKRKGLVLAVRPKKLGDAHRADLAQKSDRLSGETDTQQEFKAAARKLGKKVKIDTEFDD